MLLGVAVVKAVAMTTLFSLGADIFFFEGGNRKPEPGQLPEQ